MTDEQAQRIYRQPGRSHARGPSGTQMIIGSVLIALGILFLVDSVIPIRRLLIPMALIVLGLAVMAAGRSRS